MGLGAGLGSPELGAGVEVGFPGPAVGGGPVGFGVGVYTGLVGVGSGDAGRGDAVGN